MPFSSERTCENCTIDIEGIIYLYRDEEMGVTYSVCKDCYDLLKLDNNKIFTATTSSTSTTSSIVPATVPAIPKVEGKRCEGCFKTIPLTEPVSFYKGKVLCKECEQTASNLDYWSENYEKGQLLYDGEIGNSWYIDIDMLRQYCTSPEEWFHNLPGAQVVPANSDEYTFFDHGADVLFVGHLDIAGNADRSIFAYFEGEKTGKHFVWNRNLDDRLGVFIGHYLLPTQFGIQCDVLLTTNEESGGSTAQDFVSDWLKKPENERKHYNWIIEFDRREDKPVFYQYRNPEWQKAVQEFIPTTFGSLSDISYMDKMGVSAVNWSTGYYNEHTSRHHAVLEVTMDSVNAFVDFYRKYKDTRFPHEYAPKFSAFSNSGRYADWDEDFYQGRYANSGAYPPVDCERCKKGCYNRYRVVDAETGEALLICKTCQEKEMGYESRLSRISKRHGEITLYCENCGADEPQTYVYENMELCWECFLAKLKGDDTLSDRCTKCNTHKETMLLLEEGWVCLDCHNKEMEEDTVKIETVEETDEMHTCSECGLPHPFFFEQEHKHICESCYWSLYGVG